jgi:carbon-monoxide dehydrogenase small subunit/xanthine dehydrogenase small subunit
MPATLDEALGLYAQAPEAVPMAGGTDLLVCWPEHVDRREQTYLDLSGVSELRALRWHADHVELGALVSYWDVLQDDLAARELPILLQAACQVGAVQIQSRGTWAGNIANASPAADGVPVLMACDAIVTVASTRGIRQVPLAEFYSGYKRLDLHADELITSIQVPRRPRDVQVFHKVGPRRAQAITKVGVAVTRSQEGWRIVANSVAPTVCRCRHTERLLQEDRPLRGPGALQEALQEDVAPIDDIRSTAGYRRDVLGRILYHALSKG